MSKQSVGGHQVFSESECSAEYKASLACLDRNKYDKSLCADEFERYKECKKKEVRTRAERRRLKVAAEKETKTKSSIPEASGSMYEAMNRVRLFATVPARHKRNQQGMKKQKALPLKNDQITERELRVVFPEGDPLGTRILPLEEAKKEASQRGLDLVLASNQSDPPVARITSWEKLVFTMRQKEKAQERAARENRKLASPKEIRIGCHIAPHDLDVKLSSARKILQDNHLLKVSVTFKGGREIEPAKKVLDDILQSLSSLGRVKDPKHVQKAQMNRWAVQLEPIPSSSSSSSSSSSTL